MNAHAYNKCITHQTQTHTNIFLILVIICVSYKSISCLLMPWWQVTRASADLILNHHILSQHSIQWVNSLAAYITGINLISQESMQHINTSSTYVTMINLISQHGMGRAKPCGADAKIFQDNHCRPILRQLKAWPFLSSGYQQPW